MPETPTPGQICYEAWWHSIAPDFPHGLWADVLPQYQAAWEAAAQHVLAEPWSPFLYALGAQVRLVSATRPRTILHRRWTQPGRLPPYAEYGFAAADGTVCWELEADLVPWEAP